MDYLSQIEHTWGTDYHLSSKEVRYCCPFCLQKRGKPDNTYSFSANRQSSKYQCFKCGAKGQLSRVSALHSAEGSPLVSFLEDMFIDPNSTKTEEEDGEELVSFGKSDLTKLARKYLSDRGITDSDIEYYGICGSIDPRLSLRIIVPNQIFGDFTDMYVARSYTKYVEPKYLNPEDSNKANVVFNLFRLKQNCERLICCEGVFSAISAGRDAVCCYGSKPSDSQLKQIINKNPKEFIACLDNDLAGFESNIKLAIDVKRALPDCKSSFIPMPNETDPSDMGHENFIKFLELNKVPVSTNDNIDKILQFYSRKVGDF